MDDRTFDRWTRSLAARHHRRSLLKGLLGLGAAAVGAVGSEEAEAQPNCPPPRRCGGACCPAAQKCCNGTCCPNGRCNTDATPNICCVSGTKQCGTTCIPTGDPCCHGASCDCPNGVRCGPDCCDLPNQCLAGVCTTPECVSPAACPPGNPATCTVATCIGGVCGLGPAPSDTICRFSANLCDSVEYCDGTNQACPADVFSSDGVPCGDDGGFCCGGVCTTGTCCAGTGIGCEQLADPICCFGEYCRSGPVVCCRTDLECGAGSVCCGGTCALGECCTGIADDGRCEPDICCPGANGTVCVAGSTCEVVGECMTDGDCDDDNFCTSDSCDPLTGQCAHTPVDCDDGFACTTDSCDPRFGCSHTVNCVVCQQCSLDMSACVPSPNGGECRSPDGEVGACVHGQCMPGLVGCDAFGCDAGLACCENEICRDLSTDIDNCGACGNVCAADHKLSKR